MVDKKHESEVWARYNSGDPDARNDLILIYMPLVNYVAKKVYSNLPASVDLDDLVNDGFFGLVDAIEKFEPDRGFQFQTYAVSRIRGEIIDRLRSADWVPRSLRSKFRLVENASRDIESKHQRFATNQEIADYLEWDIDELNKINSLFNSSSFSGLDDIVAVGDNEEKITVIDTISDYSYSPSVDLEIDDLMSNLIGALESLPERERVVLILYYFEDLNLQTVGGLLDVTESRVCQIHTKALSSLRAFCLLS